MWWLAQCRWGSAAPPLGLHSLSKLMWLPVAHRYWAPEAGYAAPRHFLARQSAPSSIWWEPHGLGWTSQLPSRRSPGKNPIQPTGQRWGTRCRLERTMSWLELNNLCNNPKNIIVFFPQTKNAFSCISISLHGRAKINSSFNQHSTCLKPVITDHWPTPNDHWPTPSYIKPN